MTVRLVISDVDGTLVTSDKALTPRTREAVASLHDRGIGFSIVSSRPPFGMRQLAGPLKLDLPFAGFNGGMIVAPDLSLLEQNLIDEATAIRAIALLGHDAVEDVWLFTAEAWHVRDPGGPYVERERRTVLRDPVVVEDYHSLVGAAGKIVGVGTDFERLKTLEDEVRQALGGTANAVCSQPYYLDVTAAGFDKGTAVRAILGRTGIGADELVVLGDMENDLPMFAAASFSIAMGNASAAVKGKASAVTRTNDADGFAHAIETIVLPRAQGR